MSDNGIVPAATASVAQRDAIDMASWPLWTKVLIGRIEAGTPIDEAIFMDGCKVSWPIIKRTREQVPGFADALDRAIVGQRVLGVEDARDIARAYGTSIIADAYAESRDRELAPRDRLGNRRLVLEVAGAMPSRNAGAPGPVLNIGQLVVQLNGGDGVQQARVDA